MNLENLKRSAGVVAKPGLLTLSKSFDDQSEVEEGKKHDIEFIEAREEAAEAFETPEEPLDLVAPAVHGFVILPRRQTIALGRDHGNPAELQGQLAGRIVFVSAVHDEIERRRQRSDAAQKLAALHRVRGFSGREREG